VIAYMGAYGRDTMTDFPVTTFAAECKGTKSNKRLQDRFPFRD